MSTPSQQPPAYLDEWREKHRRRSVVAELFQTPADGVVVLTHFLGTYAHLEPVRSYRKVLGVKNGDALLTIIASPSDVRPAELVALRVARLRGYQIGHLGRDSFSQWRISIGDYESPYFSPSDVEYFARVLSILRDNVRFPLRCQQAEAPAESARVITFPAQTWHSAAAVAAGIIADAAASGQRREKGTHT